jgi:copper chaperone
MTEKTLKVEGMSCDHCRMAVSRAVSSLSGVEDVQVSLEQKMVNFRYDESRLPLEIVRQAIRSEGYEVVS